MAFAVLLPDTPPAWRAFVEELTRRNSMEEPARELLRTAENGLLSHFDIAMLPLGLACGKANVSLDLLRELISGRDELLRQRALGGAGMTGLYFPTLSLDLLRGCLSEGTVTPEQIVAPLSTFYPLHPRRVDLFLQAVDMEELRSEVAAQADFRRVSRHIGLIGHYNNGVNEGVRYPRMRVGMLEPVYRLYMSSKDTSSFIREYARGTLKMLRAANYRMLNWVDGAPT